MKIRDIANAYYPIMEFSDSIGGYIERPYVQHELEELEKYLGEFIKEATKDERETFEYLCKKCERYDKANIVPEHFNPIEESFSFLNKCIKEKFTFAEEPFNKSTVDKFLYAGKFITENCVKLNEDTFIGQMKELNLSSIMNKVSKDLDKMKDINEKIKELENTNLTKGEFDIKHLKKINKLIGCKGHNCKGIKKAKEILKQLKDDNYLKGFKKNQMNQFGKALTNYYNELRKANVFKEANTFTTRLFIKELARENGYDVNIYKEHFSLNIGLTRINKDNELVTNDSDKIKKSNSHLEKSITEIIKNAKLIKGNNNCNKENKEIKKTFER